MAGEIFLVKNSDKMDCDLEIFENQDSEYTEWLKSNSNKRIWPEGMYKGRQEYLQERELYTTSLMVGQNFFQENETGRWG